MTIAADNVEPVLLNTPRRWDVGFIRRFMLVFGLLSSVFDYVTFAVLLQLFGADPVHFRSGWFVESVLSATVVVFALRTRLPLQRSQPSRVMLTVTALVAAATVTLPFTPLADPLGFAPLRPPVLAAIVAIVGVYFVAAEFTKRLFYAHYAVGH